jgi:hypothetical protein
MSNSPPKHGELVKAAAAEAKISERNLIAAAERLGVRSRQGEWWLPGYGLEAVWDTTEDTIISHR